MKARRNSFARETLTPVRVPPFSATCSWCDAGDPTAPDELAHARIFTIRIDHDGGRTDQMKGAFCSWSCAESYHDAKLG